MGWVLLRRPLIVVTLCVATSACSVANYKKPIEDFTQATKDTAEALEGLDKQVRDGYTDLLRRRVLARTLQLGMTEQECQTESERCRLIVRDETKNSQPYLQESVMPKILILMASIRQYADHLAAIVNADTASQVTTQVTATVVSLGNLAGTIAKLGGADNTASVKLADYATPVGNLANWLAGQYIGGIQLEGLRRATVDARPVLAGAVEIFDAAATAAARVPRAQMAEEVRTRMDALRAQLSERSVEEVVQAALRYDKVLVAKPSAVFERLVSSHDALVAKIQDENVTLADVVARIEIFATEAKSLMAIVKELQAAGKKKGEG
jgi:hypothetical protein